MGWERLKRLAVRRLKDLAVAGPFVNFGCDDATWPRLRFVPWVRR